MPRSMPSSLISSPAKARSAPKSISATSQRHRPDAWSPARPRSRKSTGGGSNSGFARQRATRRSGPGRIPVPSSIRLSSCAASNLADAMGPPIAAQLYPASLAIGCSTSRSDLDLTAELDDAVRGDPKELGRVERVVRHQNEECVTPAPQSLVVGTRPLPHFFAPDDERGLHQIEAEAADPALREGAQDIWLVHEPVADADRIEALAELADFEPLLVRNMRHVLGLDLHYHDALVQHLVVLEGMQQGDRNMCDVAGHEDSRPRDAGRPVGLDRLDELLERHRVPGAQLGEQPTAAPPCSHYREHDYRDDDREPAAVGNLQQIGAKEGKIDDAEGGKYRYCDREA